MILRELTSETLKRYRKVLKKAGNPELACGFICGREEMANWNRLEIPCLLKSTRDYYGKLSEFVPEHSPDDLRLYIKLSLNNLYHAMCHTYVHGNMQDALPEFYKSAFFILQSIHFLNTGNYINTRKALKSALYNEVDKTILLTEGKLKSGDTVSPDKAFDILLGWCKVRTNAGCF